MPVEPDAIVTGDNDTGPFVIPTPRRIEAVSRRLAGGTIAIIGLGGTGSLVLDLISKTPADRITLTDGDRAEQHNAFR